MESTPYIPRHAGPYPGDAPVALAAADTLYRLRAYSRRSKRGVVERLDERRAMREALRPVRTDHFGGEAA